MYGIVRIGDCQIDYSKLVTNYGVYEELACWITSIIGG